MLISKQLQIGPLRLKNRFVMSAMATGYPELSGEPNERFIKYLERRAIGGVAMIVVESTGVTDSFRYNVRTPSIGNDGTIPKWKELATAIHQHDCYVCLQLQHPGRQVYPVSQGPIISASSLPTKVTGVVPRAMTIEEIKQMVNDFGQAARRAKDANIDAVEIHGGHGYLFSQFLSTASNIREDEYGGDLENRFRFLKEVIESIQAEAGKEYPIIARLSFEEFTGEGITLEETLQVSKWLEEMGVVAIRVSGGSLDQSKPAMIPPTDVEKGLFWPFSKIAKEHLNIPVDVVGRIQSPLQAEQLLQSNYADFVSLGRPLIADPDYVNKALQKESGAIKPCIACNQGCIDRLLNYDIGEVSCLMNPSVGQEWNEAFQLTKTEQPEHVVVVGAGPAGVEAARTHALQGHQVTLIDQAAAIGGLFKIAATPPGKQDFIAFFDYYEQELARLNVKVCLNTKVDEVSVEAFKPDTVIWATGSQKVIEKLPIQAEQLLCEDIYTQGLSKDKKVLFYGAEWESVETALYLKERGYDVTIIEPNEKLGNLLSPVTRRWYLKKKLKNAQVPIYEGVKDVTWTDTSCILQQEQPVTVHFDVVVLESKKQVPTIAGGQYKSVVIGDAKQSRNAFFAIREGYISSLKEQELEKTF